VIPAVGAAAAGPTTAQARPPPPRGPVLHDEPRNRSVRYTTSPLLASKTPVWRSKFIVAGIALGFVMLAGRAAYVQVFNNSFFQRQGEVRFARTLELPANRGRILDRNGLILASSVVAPSIWAIPEDIEREDPEVRAKLKQVAKLLEMPQKDFDKKLEDEDKTFVWIKRQVDEPIAKQIAAMNLKGIYQRKEYKRQYPEGEAAAHVVGFTNVEDNGQEGIELSFNKELAGKAGSRRVIKDRLGRVVEGVGDTVPPLDGQDIQLSVDSKVQFFAYQKLRDAVTARKAKAGSVVVLDAITGEVLALANYPSYVPDKRQNLTGEQLRNRAITDTFEPGSTMKPITVGMALEAGRVKPSTLIETGPGRFQIGGFTISDTHNYGTLTVEGVIQKSSNVGALKIAQKMTPARNVGHLHRARLRPEAADPVSRRGHRPAAPVEDLEAGRAGHHGLWLRPVGVAVPDGAFVHLVRARRLDHSGHHPEEHRAAGGRAGVLAVQRAGGAQDAADGRRPRRHRHARADGRLLGRRQVGHGPQAGRQGLRQQQVPRLVHRHGAHREAAHHRRRDDRRAQRRPVLRRLAAAPVFSEVVQQTLRMMNVAPDLAVKPLVLTQGVPESF
jgi:cell division protein FtsI (penicillin-binding protein 3)